MDTTSVQIMLELLENQELGLSQLLLPQRGKAVPAVNEHMDVGVYIGWLRRHKRISLARIYKGRWCWPGCPCQCHPESVPTCCHQSCIPVSQQAQDRPPNQLIQMRPKPVKQGGEVRASKEFKYYEPGHVQPLAT